LSVIDRRGPAELAGERVQRALERRSIFVGLLKRQLELGVIESRLTFHGQSDTMLASARLFLTLES
jgi:hypothetical protein